MVKVHLIGIGGSGLSAIARVLLESGYTVSGSDRQVSPVAESLRASGVRLMIGHQASNVQGVDLVIRSSAIPDDNPEVVAAQQAGIPVLKRAGFLRQLTSGKRCIAVAGSHGKTTTTAMIAWMLMEAGQDPSFIVGGVLKNLGVNARAGKGNTFVIEADEYDRMFLGLTPEIMVITNIDYDHPDCFPTRELYRQAFMEFTGQLAEHGTLLACNDDPGAAGLLSQVKAPEGSRLIAYGLGSPVTYQASQIKANTWGGFDFVAEYQSPEKGKVRLAQISLQVPGEHNVRNSLAALAVGHCLGLPMEMATKALHSYMGSGRRFEVVGEFNGIVLIDDYAHHPTEIRTTLAAARSRYPDHRIWAVWQPHTYSRTLALKDEFTAAFNDADQVVVTEIYAAREPNMPFSSSSLVAMMPHPAAHFVPTLYGVVEYLSSRLAPGDVVLVLSAGDAVQINARLLAFFQQQFVGKGEKNV